MGRDSHVRCPQPGEWLKGKLVGSGSFSTVHLAMSKSTGGLFVVKSARSAAGIKDLENEAKILKTLNSSPYIVQCMGTEYVEENLNVFMEYVAGGSLSDVVDKFGGSLHEEVVRLYTREILRGLEFLHENGVVHCDLKCKNVLLGSAGDLKLADFGCAKRLRDIRTNRQQVMTISCKSVGGTPLWMAPEVLKNERLDFGADIWSLGCTVIEMATGKSPWAGHDFSNAMAAVLNIACSDEIPQFPKNFSEEGLDFLAKCLERDRTKRWSAVELLNHPFVSSNNSTRTSPEEFKYAFSPSSILEIRKLEDAYDSDESESDQLHSSICRNPFSRCSEEKKGTARWLPVPEESIFGSSDNWITVRSA